MSDPKPHRSWWRRKRVWAAGVFVWLVAYVLSYGPACRIFWRSDDPRVWRAMDWAYWPIDELMSHGPEPVAESLLWYMRLWRLPEWDEYEEAID